MYNFLPSRRFEDSRIKALRSPFFIGFFEFMFLSGIFCPTRQLVCSRPTGKESSSIRTSSAISSMFAAYLQAALYKGLNGSGGLSGRRWMFIFDAIIGIPIAVWGFWAIPDLPHNTRAFYFTEEVGVLTLTVHKGTRS